MRLWWKLAAALCALVLGGVVACNSPTIPIPPLHVPSIQMMGANTWTVTGDGAEADAEVFVIDRTSGNGVSTRANASGGYTTPAFMGQMGDQIELFYRNTGGELSPSICAALAAGTPAINACP